MRKQISNKKGIIWNTLGSAMHGFNSFIMLAMVSRIGTAEEVGAFSIAFSTAQVLYFIGLFGVNHYHMTDYQKRYSFWQYARIRMLSCILMLLAGCVVIVVLGFSGEKRLYAICLILLMLINAVASLFQSLFFQHNRLDLAGASLFFRTFWALLTFCSVLVIYQNILTAICLQIMVNILVTIYYVLRYAIKYVRILGAREEIQSTLSLLNECLPLFGSTLLMNIVINSPKYGIELTMNDAAQGYFGMIFMPVQVINLCTQFLFKPVLNEYAKVLEEKKITEFYRLLKKQLISVAGFTLICSIAAAAAGAKVLGFVYNKDLTGLTIPLVIVIVGGGIYAATQLYYYIFVILRRQKEILKIYSLTTIASVFLTMGMVHALGIWGAVLSFAVTHILINGLYILLLKRYLNSDKE